MSKALRASALVLLLASSAHAGWMPNGSTEPPPPPSHTQVETEETADAQETAPDGVMESVWSLLTSLSSLF